MTAWVWKRLRSPVMRKLLYCALLVTILLGVWLHLEGALFAFRARSLLLELRQIDAGQTTRDELLRLVPSLHRNDSIQPNCGRSGEHLQLERSNWPTSSLAQRVYVALHENTLLYNVTYSLGYRPTRLYVDVDVDKGVVIRWAFSLGVAPPENHYPGEITVGVSSPISVLRYSESPVADEQNPNFSARRYFKWPQWSLEASYSRLAADDIKDASVDLHVACVWSLRGCSNATQLLPRVEEERLRVRRAAIERMASAEPCPPFITSAKVRDADEIVILKIKSSRQAESYWKPSVPGFAVRYEIIRTLELREANFGRVRRDEDWLPSRIMHGDLEGTVNPSTLLIQPGATLVAFEGRGAAASPCKLLPARPDILSRINEALILKDWSYG